MSGQLRSAIVGLLSFMTKHLFRFRFTYTEQYWHPSWLITLASFGTGKKHLSCVVWFRLPRMGEAYVDNIIWYSQEVSR